MGFSTHFLARYVSMFCMALAVSVSLFAQSARLDSLQSQLLTELDDTTRINLWNEIAEGVRFSDPDLMYTYSLKAKSLATQLKFEKGLVKSVYNLSTYFASYLNEDSVGHYFDWSLRLSDSLGFPEIHVLTQNAFGLHLVSKRRFDEAHALFFEVLAHHERTGNAFGQMAVHNNIGLVYMELRQYQKAIDSFKQGLPLIPEPHPVILTNIGSCFGSLAQYDSARVYTTYGIQRSREMGNLASEANGLHILGTVYISEENYDDALAVFLEAEQLRDKVPNPAFQVSDYTNIASLYAKLNEPEKGIEYGTKALKMVEEQEIEYKIENVYEALAQNYEAAGNFAQAAEYLKKWGAQKDSSYTRAQSEAMAEMETRYKTAQQQKEIAQKEADLTREQLKVRQRNSILTGLAGLFAFVLILGGLFFRQQAIHRENLKRQNELKLQLANAEAVSKLHQERERISRDLHDNVGSQITNLISGIEISNIHIRNANQNEAALVLKTLDAEARNTMTDLRETIWLLDKDEVPFEAFMDHLKGHLNRQKQFSSGLAISTQSLVKSGLILNPMQSLNIIRIIQEALNNTRKYADASTFDIHFSTHENTLLLTIKDNGRGMKVDATHNVGYGLGNMKKRAELIGAEIMLESSLDEGTFITLTLKNIEGIE